MNKYGLEIGGPSNFFGKRGYMPVYSKVRALDGVNWSADTLWNSQNAAKGFFVNGRRMGDFYAADATDLSTVNKEYDFVLSCNNIEHIANPLKAVQQWIGKLKTDGILVLVAPRRKHNFDHRRKVVQFEHCVDDFENNVGEDDLSHLDEILELHDLRRDKPAGNYEQFKARSLKNIENRCLHHHVFDLETLERICKYFNLQVVFKKWTYSDYIVIAKK
jgi:SAM-dependent methyltransferase